jgi:hypothetical protein
VADDHALADAAFDHRRPQRAGVEVDEALVHHRGASGEVGTEPDPIGVRDANTVGHDVVGHSRELVHAQHHHGMPRGSHRRPPAIEALDRARPGGGPHHVVEQPEHVAEVDAMGRHQPMGEQVEAEVDVMGVDGRIVQTFDEGGDDDRLYASHVVDPARGREVEVCEPGDVARRQLERAGHRRLGSQLGRTPTHCLRRVETGLWIPRVQGPTVQVQRGHADAPGATGESGLTHGGPQ